MIEQGTKRQAAAAGLGFALMLGAGWAAPPAAAQSYGPKVVACVADSADAVQLGSFDAPMGAINAARARRIRPGQYAIATIRGERIAIDSEAVMHQVSTDPCYGSGRRMKPPQSNSDEQSDPGEQDRPAPGE